MMIVCVLSSAAVWIRAYTFNTMSDNIARMLKYDLVFALLNKDIGFYDNQTTGDILSRIGTDSQILQDGLSTNISMFLRAFIFIIATVVILSII